MRSRNQWVGLILVGIALLLIMYTWATWQFFTKLVPGGNDFIANVTAWEAYLKHGINPYSDEAARFTQQAIYGRPARPTEDQNRLTYPFYSIILHGPFVLINDYALARAIYMTLLQLALFVGVIILIALLRWRPPFWLIAMILLWSLLYYPDARGIILGQFAIFGFFALVAALGLIRRGRNVAGGAVLVVATMKPTLVFLAVPFLLVWAIVQRRWRLVIGFLATLIVLMLLSWLMLPTWFNDWLFRIANYSGYTVGQSPIWLLTHQVLPTLGDTGEMIVDGILLIGMARAWRISCRRQADESFWWALSITLVVSNLIVARSATTNYVMLLIPALWLFTVIDRRWAHGRRLILLYLIVSLIGLWWLHAVTVVGNQEQAIMFIPVPVVLGLMLAWITPGLAFRRSTARSGRG
jgi:hypothetical protein